MARRPVIGVAPLYDVERESMWMLPGYLQVVEACGGIPVTLSPWHSASSMGQVVDMLDGVLLTGGNDIDPALYGHERSEKCGVSLPERDKFEMELLSLAQKRGLPVLGICRGCQLLNVFYGGTLYQDLPTERPEGIAHRMTKPYDLPFHDVDVLTGTPLAQAVGVGPMGVNSRHHQAIRDLGVGLSVMATAPDGLVEAIWDPLRPFVWGVQWHSEHSWERDPLQKDIVQAFVDACAATTPSTQLRE